MNQVEDLELNAGTEGTVLQGLVFHPLLFLLIKNTQLEGFCLGIDHLHLKGIFTFWGLDSGASRYETHLRQHWMNNLLTLKRGILMIFEVHLSGLI